MKQKTLDVCICTKNRANVINKLVNKIANLYDDMNILVCDDLSKDNTIDTLLDLQAKYPDKVFAWQNEKEGYINCLNFILSKTKSNYICILDDDDIISDNKFKEQIEYLKQHKTVDVVSTMTMFPDRSVLKNSYNDLNNTDITNLLKENESMYKICHFQSCMFRRKCLDLFSKGKYFYEEYSTGRPGEGFLYTLHYNGFKFANIKSTTYVYTYRFLENSMSNTIIPEFANAIDVLDYENKKVYIDLLFKKYNS